MTRSICALVALTLAACQPTLPPLPPEYAQQRAETKKQHRAALDERAAAAAEIDAATAAVQQAEANVRALEAREQEALTSNEHDGLSAADADELSRSRRELSAANQRLEAANAAHSHADQGVEATAERLRSLKLAPEVHLERWSAEQEKKYRRMNIAGLPIILVASPLALLGLYGLHARPAIIEGRREFPSPAERDATLRRMNRFAIIGYGIGMPLLITGLTLTLVSFKGRSAIRRLTLSADGVGFRF